MGWLAAVWMIVLGVLGASDLIIARKPEAKELIAKLTPYQGWMGAISALWGVWVTVWTLIHVSWMHYSVLWWFTMLAEGVTLLALGLILGAGVLKSFVKQPEAVAKIDLAVAKLMPLQGTLGLVGIGLGVWGIAAMFIYRLG